MDFREISKLFSISAVVSPSVSSQVQSTLEENNVISLILSIIYQPF